MHNTAVKIVLAGYSGVHSLDVLTGGYNLESTFDPIPLKIKRKNAILKQQRLNKSLQAKAVWCSGYKNKQHQARRK